MAMLVPQQHPAQTATTYDMSDVRRHIQGTRGMREAQQEASEGRAAQWPPLVIFSEAAEGEGRAGAGCVCKAEVGASCKHEGTESV